MNYTPWRNVHNHDLPGSPAWGAVLELKGALPSHPEARLGGNTNRGAPRGDSRHKTIERDEYGPKDL